MKYQVMPDLTPIEYEALKADIAERGVLVPVEVDENGELLDGHHRVRAWQELRTEGVNLPDYPCMVRFGLTEVQKRNHARSLNVLRRQLSKEQRDAVMVDMRRDGMSYRAIAEATGVSHEQARQTVKNSGVKILTPVTGTDGKTYPAQQPQPEPQPLPAWAQDDEPDGEEEDATWAAGAVGLDRDWTDDELDGYAQANEVILVAPEPRNDMAIHYSSESPEHYTPKKIIDATLWCLGEIDLDPCSNSHETPNVPAALHYTAEDDGLAQEWHGRVYMNPPYGREIGAWVDKLIHEHKHGGVTYAIALLPARTDTQWFVKLRDYPVCFVTGRLTFIGNDDPAPFPSAVFYLGDDIEQFYYAFVELGDIWVRAEPGVHFAG